MVKFIKDKDQVSIEGFETFYALDMDTIFRAAVNLCLEFQLLNHGEGRVSLASTNPGYDSYLMKLVFELLEARGILLNSGTSDEYLVNPSYKYYFNDSLLSMKSTISVDHTKYTLLKQTLLKRDAVFQKNKRVWKDGDIACSDWCMGYVRNLQAVSISPMIAQVEAGVFNDVDHVIDAGGGGASLLLAADLCRGAAGSEFDYTLSDLHPMCDSTIEYLKGIDFHRIPKVHYCNFFSDEWTTAGDCYHFSNVLHSWNIQECKYLLERAFNALPENGKLVVHEVLVDKSSSNKSWTACAFNILSYITCGERKFSFSEIQELLRSTGFSAISIASQFLDYSTVVAYRR